MKKQPVIAGSVLLLLGLTGCIIFRYGLDNGLRMDPGVYALDGINTPYDDFNATPPPPPLYMDTLLVFAANAASEGGTFRIDMGRLRILQKPFHHYRDKRPGRPAIDSERMGRFPGIPDLPYNLRGPSALISRAAPRRRETQARESPEAGNAQAARRLHYEAPTPGASDYRPPPEHTHHMALVMDAAHEPLAWEEDARLAEVVWMFDSDEGGRRNLYFVDAGGAAQPFFGNDPGADDAYASYDYERHVIYFSSNRSGRFEIYRYRNTSGNTEFRQWLGDPSLAQHIERVAVFSSAGDTMAPFVEGDTMVMASNRPGGQGGFDLYLAHYGEEDWDVPVNLQDLMPRGVRVNTAANEFRPSLLRLTLVHAGTDHPYHDLRVLIFSSDRPGGQGGYDLYLTALP